MSATAWARRSYRGAAPATTLAAAIESDTLTIQVSDGGGFPTTGPFFVVLDRGEASEEKIEVASRSGDTFTVSSTAQRGVDDTTARSHTSGDTTVEHCVTAVDMDEANAASHNTVGKVDAKGDLLAGTAANELDRVPVGDDGLPLVADSSESTGVAFAELDTSGIADEAVTNDKLDDVVTWLPGDVRMSARDTPPSGWLLCDGSAVSRTTYSDLFDAIGEDYGTGDGSTTFNLPDPDETTIYAFIKT
ncbi:MAG: phage tail protein [Acidimicrobiales bacterium]